MTTCERIIDRLSALRMNQKQLSTAIGVAPSTLHTWLFRGNDFPASYAAPIAEALKVTTDWLLTGVNATATELPADCLKLSDPERFVIGAMRTVGYEGSVIIQHAAISELRQFRADQGTEATEETAS